MASSSGKKINEEVTNLDDAFQDNFSFRGKFQTGLDDAIEELSVGEFQTERLYHRPRRKVYILGKGFDGPENTVRKAKHLDIHKTIFQKTNQGVAMGPWKINKEELNVFEDFLKLAFQTSDDGFINYKDYCLFFQASNLPKHTVDQIWLVVNRKKPEEEGVVIGREEFLEALQLASVAQRYQKEYRLYMFGIKVGYLDVYDEEVLPKFDLPNVPPPNIDFFSDHTTWEITCTPKRPKILRPPEYVPQTDGQRLAQKAFDLYIRIGGDPIKSFPGFGCKGTLSRCTIHIPAECEPVQNVVYIPPLGDDINHGDWKCWEDVHENVKAIVLKEIPSLPIPPPKPKLSPMEEEQLREEKRLREEEMLKEDQIIQELIREEWLRTEQRRLGFF